MILLLAISARAQDLDGWAPSGAWAFGRGSPTGESSVVEEGQQSAAFAMAFGQDAGAGESAVELYAPIALSGGWAYRDLARADLFLPFYAHIRTDDAGWSGAATGDARLQVTVPVRRSPELGVAVLPRLSVPTGSAAAWADGGVHGGLSVVADGTRGAFGWTSQLGFTAASRVALASVETGSTLDLLAAGWYGAGGLRGGAELSGAVGLGSDSAGELTAFVQGSHPSGLRLGLAAGAGLGYAPTQRISATLSWSRAGRDEDDDGLADTDDLCPTEAEDPDGFEDTDGCPERDDDADGVPDADDRCRDVPEDKDGFEDEDGCSESDNDADTVLDVDDRCPLLAGPADKFGCPDIDEDGWSDAEDQCPKVPGPKDELRGDGCPKDAWFTATGIGVRTPIAFDIGGPMLPESEASLRAVAALLLARPELRLTIDAHVHSAFGAPAGPISRVRAERVKAGLIEAGVPEDRITTHGYGAEKPLDTNRTASGRARNERIELTTEPTP